MCLGCTQLFFSMFLVPTPLAAQDPLPHLALEEFLACLGGGPIPYPWGDSLTTHNNNDNSNNKLRRLELDKLLLSCDLV